MITIRPAAERGRGNHGWLDTRHTFSFADYHDPRHMGFRALRVINEDRVAPGQGFGTHGHADMEILSVVLEGALQHRDSLGTGSVIRPGEIQKMSAGTGVRHSEFNASPAEPVHFYQIWIEPDREGVRPDYQQKAFPAGDRLGRLVLVASPDGAQGSLTLHQDARVFAGSLDARHALTHRLADGRHAWVQVVRGELRLNGRSLREGDGAAVSGEPELSLETSGAAEVLLFDLP
jgi:redox-sensitive bicupin YhaK (pirin superfamily)